MTTSRAMTAQPVDTYSFMPAINRAGTPVLDQRLTVDDTSGGVKFAAFDARATHIFFSVETAELRFTLDASAPTTTNGHILGVGDTGVWPLSWILAAKFIRTGGVSAVIHASPLQISGT